ncbi:peptidase S9 prolyl oligopeptidase active site domain protein [Phellopilus nigrolimitatus]|nr:peptidase S9 prolyl oligopeptidase active site domain protein [Phellopilus nigrolimitatus]
MSLADPRSDLDSGFTPRKVADSEQLFDIKLSPDATQVLYHVKPLYKSNEHETCAIWLADVSTAGSARQFTSGLFNDTAAQFHPDGRRLVFLSDRHKSGGPAQLYSIGLLGGEASPLFGKENKKGVSSFEISPDGRYVAFASADEPTPDDERREKEKDDCKSLWRQARLGASQAIYFCDRGRAHARRCKRETRFFFIWTPDSKEIVFATSSQPELEFSEEETELQRIAIAPGNSSTPHLIGTYPRSPGGKSSIAYTSEGTVVDLQSFEPARLSDSKSVFIHAAHDFSSSTRLYGKVDDAARILDMKRDGLVAVEVADGLRTRIDVLSIDYKDGKGKIMFKLYETTDDAIGYGLWDARWRADGTFVLVAIRSSSARHEPPDVWAGTIRDELTVVNLETKLSSHLQWMKDVPVMHTEAFHWDAADGTKLDGVVVFPPRAIESKPPSPLPTVMIVHGGPYSRETFEYVPAYASWRFLLASHGYLVVSPNYRGGQGYGSDFARAAHGGMGTLDWSDCESMLNEAVARGLADPGRLGIGGWSQGGFMTAWGVATTKNRFKAGVMGAGVCDWGQLAAESDLPEFETDLGGSAPWDTPVSSERVDMRGSPIGHVANVETAVLILHGEKDQRVPATQGISFFRGLRRRAKYPERAQLVIYPREPHGFTEKKHAEDVMKRVIEHFDHWL